MHMPDLQRAGPWQDYGRGKLGEMDSRVALRSFEEVRAHNAAGQCWLVLDGALACSHAACSRYLIACML